MFKISKGNTKLGKLFNVNLPAITTCEPNVPCASHCYACKGTYYFTNVKKRYQENLETFANSPDLAKNDILSQLPITGNHYCRLHSSGDFVNMDYLDMIVEIVERRPNIQFLAFTKKYSMINKYLEINNSFPDNLKIVFSYWENYPMPNIHFLPIAVVAEFSSPLQLQEGFPCTGKCTECYHCWDMQGNDMVVFHKH